MVSINVSYILMITMSYGLVHIQGVIEEYGEGLDFKNLLQCKIIAINPSRFKHTCPVVLATF